MGHAQVIAWIPLGELLVERALVSTDEVESALAEQAETGERLGAILVARKAITGVTLTMVLAEQAGIPLERQRGFGSGLFSKLAERHGLDEQPAPPSVPTATVEPWAGSAHREAAPDDVSYELSALRAEVETLRLQNEELEAELAARPKAPRRRKAKTAAQ